MGAINFNIDINLAKLLKNKLSITHFVETGTFKGDSLNLASQLFEHCHSVEWSEVYYAAACERFAGNPNIILNKNDSPSFLKAIRSELFDKAALYWLDAHWCAAPETAGAVSQCPLIKELSAIDSLNNQSVILIDDARLFLAPPPAPHATSDWPQLHDIIVALIKLSTDHRIIVINDVIVFFPKIIYHEIEQYAYTHGTDWLKIADTARIANQYLDLANEKEEQIQILAESLRQRDARIKSLSTASWRKARRSILKFIYQTPHPLGILYQYAPKPLIFNAPQPPKTTSPLPEFCILTPSYNQAVFLERTILSILDQGYPHLRYGIQDGASTDGSQNILKKYTSRLTYADSRPDTGQATAINFGFAQMKPRPNEIMAWVNSDDMLLPGALKYVAAVFTNRPEVDVIYGHRIIINEHDEEVGRWFLPQHCSSTIQWVDYIPQETLFWRSSAWEKANGLNPSFQFALDWDLLARFEEAGLNIYRVPHFLGCFRVHSEQKTSLQINSTGKKEMDQIRFRLNGFNNNPEHMIKHAAIIQQRKSCISYRKYKLASIFKTKF